MASRRKVKKEISEEDLIKKQLRKEKKENSKKKANSYIEYIEGIGGVENIENLNNIPLEEKKKIPKKIIDVYSYDNYEPHYEDYVLDKKYSVEKNESILNHPPSKSGYNEMDNFDKNLHKWIDFVSWARWNIDLFYDLISPEMGGIRLDLDQRVFLRSVARFLSIYGVFPRGYGKCISGDSLLFTRDGIKEIGEYFNYQEDGNETFIKSDIKLLNRYNELESTNAGVYSGYKETKIIQTEEGYKLEASLNHPLLIMSHDGNLEWKKSEDIKVGDYLPINRKNDMWGKNTKLDIDMDTYLNSLSKSSRWKVESAKCNIVESLDENLALIIGYLLGDGCITQDNVIIFSNKDEDILGKYINYFKNVLNIDVRKKKGNNVDYVVTSMYTRELFNQMGLKKCDAFTKEIPKCILEAPKNIVSKVIQGLFDTDGGISNSYIEYCTASEKMSKQVQTILLNFGIISTRRIKYNKKYKTNSYITTIYGKNMNIYLNEIGFSCNRKHEKLKELCSKKRNPNKDIIPFQKELINIFYKDAKKHNSYVYDEIYHILKGNNQLTYEKLSYLLSLDCVELCEGYKELKELLDLKYFYSKVNSIEDCSNHVYDLSLPETNSFISNGFISHNTLLELMALYHTAIFFPDIELSMTAQTRENASKLMEEKHREIMKFYPLMANEISKASFAKDMAEIKFVSGSIINVLANHQSSKGARRKRLMVEESALLDNR